MTTYQTDEPGVEFHLGRRVVPIEFGEVRNCLYCAFIDDDCRSVECIGNQRHDGKTVYFKGIE